MYKSSVSFVRMLANQNKQANKQLWNRSHVAVEKCQNNPIDWESFILNQPDLIVEVYVSCHVMEPGNLRNINPFA